MKILHLIDVPWDSGITHYALVLALGQKKRGHPVFISARPGEKPWAKARRMGLKTVPLVETSSLGALRSFIKTHGFDVVNAHTGHTHSLAVAATLGRPVAVVRTRADARTVRSSIGSRLLFARTARVIAAADYIRREYLQTLKLPPRNVKTIHQGIDAEEFKRTPWPKDPVIGIVARLDPVKGHRVLLSAVALISRQYPWLRVHVIGQEENVKVHELENHAAALGIADQVRFLGYQNDIPAVMAECSIGVIASTGSEAVSRAALEWMAAGRAVVAARVGCLPELVDDGRTGLLVDPRNAAALGQALARLLHDPSLLRGLGEAGRKRAETEFNIPLFVSRTLDVYRDALKDVRS